MKRLIIASPIIALLGACANPNGACEDVVLASEQVQACQNLQRQIAGAKKRPILRGELERRYQQDCVEIRYYRDDKQVAVCGNKANVEYVQKNPDK